MYPQKSNNLETTVTKPLTREDLLKAYRTMRTIREFEEIGRASCRERV